uniref:Putative transcriptional coactivator caper rrm superfamily n=1 Tax=Lutzomyia longipalpis TaxID=7200 RepID=A0A1B0C887_LUTLO
MAEDLDVEAMLEAPYRKDDDVFNSSPSRVQNGRDKENKRGRSRSRSHDRSGGDKDRSLKKSRDANRSREKRRRSRSKERRRSRSKDKESRRRRSRSGGNRRRSRSKNGRRDLSPEERDARTVFCMQLSQRIRARDLEEFFSSVGKVRDVRLITCNKTKRFKGIAYIEFKDPESVPLALGLSGQKLLGIPISVQHTQAEKNRLANAPPAILPKNPVGPMRLYALGLSGQKLLGIPISVQHTQAEKNRLANAPPAILPKNPVGPMRLYVGSLHFNITEDMLRGIFEPFGKIDSIQLIMDNDTGRSKGYGFITFHNAEDAKKALEQLNGFELAGRPMKVGNVTERLDMNTNTSLDTDEMDRSGIDLGATGRLQLMFKLAEGAGLAVPQAAANALLATAPQQPPSQPPTATPPIATQCFMLSNMFDPSSETNPAWEQEIQDDVIEEANKHGGCYHVFVDKLSPQGNVYVKCPSIATAVLAVNSLHGRWFAGRAITAAYVPLLNYHTLFPDSVAASTLLIPTRKP